MKWAEIQTDILIIGGGGAALNAVLHAYDQNPELNITMVVKGLVGKCGCSRMVQGGINCVLNPKDSFEKHFIDTIKGGQFLNDQELAWTLVTEAPIAVLELENLYGVYFDRNPDGTIHQKPFAGQSFDRTIHKGDLTGIEIMERMRDQLFLRRIRVLENHRALELLLDQSKKRVVGALVLNITEGGFLVINAKATLLATGGGPNMYKVATPALDKSTDGMAMAFRAGAKMMDMEMVQFHPTGIISSGTLLHGVVIEEGLRGAGARLYNALGERFMERYDPINMERATRDVVSRASFLEIMNGRGTKDGGVWLDISFKGAKWVEQNFPGMVERCRLAGYDLAREPVQISPTAHYIMGGVRIDVNCRTNLDGLFVAGEDSSGVHGANRLGGNGIADSLVFGRRAGLIMVEYVKDKELIPYDTDQVEMFISKYLSYFYKRDGVCVYEVKDKMRDVMWEKGGIVRCGEGLKDALRTLQELRKMAEDFKVNGNKVWNPLWNEAMNVINMLEVSEMIVRSAMIREESRGAHYRSDKPERNDKDWLKNICMKKGPNGSVEVWMEPVVFTRLSPDEIEW
ncbi:MAG: FAD-binding protein [Nitrososphaerota archaeon]|nr:FAD-binding protein [Nitrososphaerota archaeon]